MAVLEVKNLQKSYDNEQVLRGIDFSLEQGEVLAIIGSSGSGKTTLLRCLNHLITPDAGVISVNGEVIFDASNVTKDSEREIRKKRLHFGLVFQQFNLFPQYSVYRNLTLAAELLADEEIKKNRKQRRKEEQVSKASYQEEVKKAHEEIAARADAILKQVGLSEKKNAYPCELSGGQQQRVAIARALILNPDILCFDEPTSALDPELTGEVLRVISDLKSTNSTMIVVTHEMEFARKVATKVIFMADGIIEEVGEPEAVFGQPKSEKLKNFLSKSLEPMV